MKWLMNCYRFLVLFTLVLLATSCSTRKLDRQTIINSYENNSENQDYLHRKSFKNRIDSEVPSNVDLNRIPIL